ncbi:MAG: S1 RNA-binding domain-containing protein [Planctomycetota bacterium]|nr:S1 RNA-binding domain-containing protein [Planctomycetota bacterium]
MADDDIPASDDLDKEIEAALGEQSVLDIARDELLGPTRSSDAARRAADGGPIERGYREGRVAGVTKNDVFVEFGPREQGVVPFEQFATEPKPGDDVRVYVEHFDNKEGIYVCSLRRGRQSADWATLDEGAVVAGTVKAANKGGLELQCGHITAFLPASHVSLERVDDLESLIGQHFEVEVIESDPERRKLVVSRRGILGRQRDQARAQAAAELGPGSVVSGKVTRVEPFGCFVDLGGVEGLVHVSEMSYVRVENPADHIEVGAEVKVQVLEIKEEGKRISLSIKALQQDPFDAFAIAHPTGSQVEGTVTRLASYGAFVQIAEGLEGLAHVSQLAPGGARSAREVVHIGQTLKWRVAQIEHERRRIGLSLLTDRGDRLTDDVADDDTIREVLEQSQEAEPTLGDLLKRALEQQE